MEQRLVDANTLKEHFAYITNQRFKATVDNSDDWAMFSEKEIENIIDDAPTVTPGSWSEGYHEGFQVGSELGKAFSRPQGEWIVVKQDKEGIHEIECPFCHYSKGSDFSSLITVTFERFPPFCENCGAELGIGNE